MTSKCILLATLATTSMLATGCGVDGPAEADTDPATGSTSSTGSATTLLTTSTSTSTTAVATSSTTTDPETESTGTQTTGGSEGSTGAEAETVTIGGTISGVRADVVLRQDGGDDLTVSQDGSFEFATEVEVGAAYDVTVASHIQTITCEVSAGSGTADADITDVLVECWDKLVFAGYEPATGNEPYITDGTPTGTELLLDIAAGIGDSEPELAGHVSTGEAILTIQSAPLVKRLWATDGTGAGTHQVSSTDFSVISGPVEAADHVYFIAGVLVGTEVWRTDGTMGGTHQVSSIGGGSGSAPQSLVALGDSILFTAEENEIRDLWITDGTTTSKVADLVTVGTGNSVVGALFPIPEGKYGARGQDDDSGIELVLTDGTAVGTVVVDLVQGSAGSNPEFIGGTDAFALMLARGADGFEDLWTTDGTPQGTQLLLDLGQQQTSSYPAAVDMDGTLVFPLTTPTSGTEPWVTDGTPNGTGLVTELAADAQSSAPRMLGQLASGEVLLHALTEGLGTELWITDGTADGTANVLDLNSGTSSGVYGLLGRVGPRFVFSGDDGETGAEPYATDGSANGTTLLLDICDGCSSVAD